MKRLTDFEHLPLAACCLVAAGLAAALCALAQLVSAGSAWKLLIWPSAAVGFAFAWYHGLRWLPVAAAGAGLWALAATQDPRYALILGAASMLGPWQAIRLLRRLADWKPPEYRLDSVSRFLAMSLLVSAPINALLFGGLVYTFQIAPLHQYGVAQLLLSAWLADVLGMLLVCPALLALLRPARLTADEEEVAADAASPRFSILTVLVVLGIAALAYVLHRLGQGHYAGLVLFAVFVPMIWAAASQATGRADAYTLLLAGLPLLASRAYAVTDTHGAGFGETVSVSLLLCCAVLAAQLLQALAADRSLALVRMSRQARQDMSTGLLNDRGMIAELTDRLASANRPRYGLIGLYISNYDAIHDLCGTVEAMQLEQATAQLLIQQNGTQLAARLSAGRYTMLIHAETVAQVRAVAREIYTQLSGQVFQTEHGSIRLQCHIGGLLLDPNSQISSEDCLSALSDAQAIAASVRDPQLFVEPLSQTMIDARRAHQKKIEHIRDAIRNDRIELYAQPLIDPEAPSQMRSYEVLTRLRDKDGQLIRPPEFLTLASQAQMSVPLDRGVIRLAFEWLAANPEALALTWKCSINLAGATMSDDTIADFIREQRANNAIPAAKVVFEITESEAIRNPAAASRLVDDLKAQGFGIALDDFGTGLATFEYLKRFPLDYLKIDGSFVRNLMTNPIDEEIILSTARVAKRLKLRTIAEHVHNAAIYERLTDLGVSYLQGDFFGKAMPLAEMFERQAPSTAHLRQPPPRPLSGTPLPSAPPPSVGNTVGGASVLH
ncbi:EAL domain-containing protein [Lautropia mirabilis ATCC 51599]|uniref:Cyclic diguanylate phosphodiesterase (EAL) domain protein n=1 Tax=Lautropia mirabilis ATCC 51599 TaxID=887898 RepID=E7RWE1_9BURK|nr:EAL domain-containing protein [Lautropia mirabilis]EFV95316.1 cyclic diguanylate phosphodiesterase (EAL) domain protein [Lautropia mirabilis ATCC 51599]VEH02498.1 Cyclic di-GMP phosphodiesterase YfgF [Lautropia mirabilis]